MPKIPKELSPIEVRRLISPGRYAVGGVRGLMLHVGQPADEDCPPPRSWVMRMKIGDRRREAGLGPFPEVGLADARDRARAFRKAVQEGRDPIHEKAEQRLKLIEEGNRRLTFESAAKLCHRARAAGFRSAKHRADWLSALERHAFPVIGDLPVDRIGAPEVMKVLEPIWATKTETASRVRQRMEAVMAWATVSGYRAGENPARWAGNLKELLPAPSRVKKVQHHPALPWQKMPEFMAELRKRDGAGARALELIVLTAARSGEVRFATWDEVDIASRLWTIPEERMKGGKVHHVPLTDAVINLLKSLPTREGLIFPNGVGRPISDMTISAVCKRMKVPAVPHGMRSSFKDWARSCTNYADEVSELQLAHVSSDATRAAYARDELLALRARMMEDWANFLSRPYTSGEVLHIGERASV